MNTQNQGISRELVDYHIALLAKAEAEQSALLFEQAALKKKFADLEKRLAALEAAKAAAPAPPPAPAAKK